MRRPVVLFGAFDRHNFGDLLFAHIVAALLPHQPHLIAGLAARDLRRYGGHRVEPLSQVVAQLQGQNFDLVHAGGELLTCSRRDAAVMLLDDAQAASALSRVPVVMPPLKRLGAVSSHLATDLLPYLGAVPPQARTVFNAVGGVELDTLPTAARAELLTKLGRAGWIGVRDACTQAALRTAGFSASLLPDCVTLVAELFAPRIAAHGQQGEPAQLHRAFPRGYLAVQCSREFEDERSLDLLASALDAVAVRHGLGLVLFRAGAAPWHDSAEVLARLAARLHAPRHLFASLDIWDICALIAGSRGYCGSSLHGRIVAMAHALPRLNLMAPGATGPTKHAAYAQTWDAEQPGSVALAGLADAMEQALRADPACLRQHARALADAYRASAAGWSGTV